MLKLMVAVLVMISFGAAAIPQATAPNDTDGMINGRLWSKMGESFKLGWLHGYTEGLRLATVQAHGEPCVTQVNKVYDLYPRQLSYGELMKAVNHFYENTPENAPVPLYAAIIYVTRKASGATQSELDEFAAYLRKVSTTSETKP